MSNGLKKKLGVILAGLMLTSLAQGVVIRSESPLPQFSIPQVSAYQTTGEDMAGMAVTMFFSGAPAETVIWAATGTDAGAAAGPDGDWTLSQSDDTFVNPWTLVYQGGKGLLTGFRLDGFAAGPGEVGVMFDRTFEGNFGTDDTFLGRDFEYVGADPPFATFVRYESTIAVGAAPAVGDEFRYLNVNFVTLPGFVDEFTSVPPQQAGLDGDNLRTISFYQDTNNPIVPEPTALVLLGAGALGSLIRRRRT